MIATIDFDDGWVAPVDADRRWDQANLRDLCGTYGDWLTAKVSKVFPQLAEMLGEPPGRALIE